MVVGQQLLEAHAHGEDEGEPEQRAEQHRRHHRLTLGTQRLTGREGFIPLENERVVVVGGGGGDRVREREKDFNDLVRTSEKRGKYFISIPVFKQYCQTLKTVQCLCLVGVWC